MNKIVLYGIQIDSFNRGVGALTYGHIELLKKECEFDKIYSVSLRRKNSKEVTKIIIDNQEIEFVDIRFDWKQFLLAFFQLPVVLLFKKYSINPVLDFFKDVDLVCASNGGDSYADIYGLTRLFLEFLSILLPEILGKKVIFTPQTIGPFDTIPGKIMGAIPLIFANKVFTRDEKGDKFLISIGVKSERTRDVSTFMKPQKVNYIVKPNTIGININGLMWENNYEGLENCFDKYKTLLRRLIDKLLEENYNIILIPHTYSIEQFSKENDYTAILELMKNYSKSSNISYLDKEYTSPELKYIISQTEFFIGSRMHSNLAALTTSTPTVALSYSYKFDGTFKMFNVPECVINAKNISEKEILGILDNILFLISRKQEIKEKLERVNSEIEDFCIL